MRQFPFFLWGSKLHYPTNFTEPQLCIILQVNTNGILTFRTKYSSCCLNPFSPAGPVAIAPFWADIDITRFGNIYYRRITAGTEFLKLQEIISAIPRLQIRELFVATYHQVAEFGRMNAEVSSIHTGGGGGGRDFFCPFDPHPLNQM